MSPGIVPNRRLDHGLAVLMTLFTCLVLWLPGDSIPPLEDDLPWTLPPHADKGIHGLLFFIETLFLYRSARWWPHLRRITGTLSSLGSTVIFAMLLALITEWTQGKIPQRTTDGLDLVANFAGIFAFAISHILWRRLRRRSLDAKEFPKSSS